MKVSVVIPVHNKAAHVKAAVESILNGTWRNLEVIAVDDKSTDDSLAVLRSIDDPRLRIIALPENLGPGGAANAGMDACRGEYIARMDADDISVPERLALQVAFMDADPRIGGSSGHLRLFGDSTGEWRFPLSVDACRARILFSTPIVQGACILRRSVIEAHHIRYGADWPRVGEDWLLWSRLLQVTDLSNTDHVLLHYRRDGDNISRTWDHEGHLLLLQRIFAANGLSLSTEEAELHAMGMRRWRTPPDAARVRAYRKWLDHLIALNKERHLFPPAAFVAQVEQVWHGLFHHLPPLGTDVAWAHLRCGGPRRAERLRYFVKYRINQALGRNKPAA